MNRNGPVIIIEDDLDDQELLTQAFKELGYKNELFFFGDGQLALDHLHHSDVVPFLILSDINMPRLDGFGLRDQLRKDVKLTLKCTPYLFFTTASGQQSVTDAYSRSIQGFFVKQNSFDELKRTIDIIMQYWLRCSSPNNF